jgi:hypothetical protein
VPDALESLRLHLKGKALLAFLTKLCRPQQAPLWYRRLCQW